MQLLLDDASINRLIYNNTNGSLGHVEDDTGTTMVVLERHALVH